MYVADSLFFLQHLLAGGEDDENRQMFSTKLSEILESYENNTPSKQENPEEIQNRIIEKTRRLTGE